MIQDTPTDIIPHIRPPLKYDLIGKWIESNWLPQIADQEPTIVVVSNVTQFNDILKRYDADFVLPNGYRYIDRERISCSVVSPIDYPNAQGQITQSTGAYVYRFSNSETTESVLIISTHKGVDGTLSIASMPTAFLPVYAAFSNECHRIAETLRPLPEVMVIGGAVGSFVPTVNWDEVILPADLKQSIFQDVANFFNGGVDIYKRLKLKPFRKLLLAGVPGTGKTMLCNALAKWALEQHFLVIYISAGDMHGSSFQKIYHALSVVATSKNPTLILLEELDAYLNQHDKALILNVLDGAESSFNEKGTLLLATTNYPQAIDNRVLKRPGRLDRIFVIPDISGEDQADKLLRLYLGEHWLPEHTALVQKLIGMTGAFVREMIVLALMQVMNEARNDVPLEVLEAAFETMKAEMDSRNDLVAMTQTL